MSRKFWAQVWDVLSWPKYARESLRIRIVFMLQVVLFVIGVKIALLGGGWWWGLPLLSVAVYAITHFVICAFLLINLLNPFRD